MARFRITPEQHVCPIDGTVFEVGGRGRPPRRQVYCSSRCAGIATYGNLPAEKGTHVPRPKKNRDTLHNETWLRGRYLDQQMSMDQIAAELGCSKPSVQWALRKFAIPVRDISTAKLGRPSPKRGPNYDPARTYSRHMSGAAYRGLLADQRNLCMVCQQPERRVGYTLSVDHDHLTGKIRGLLCHHCNATLGFVNDSIPLLRALIAYLEAHAERES